MPNPVFRSALATLIAVYSVALASNGDQCFNIDEIQQPEYFPCDPSAPTSNCCQSGWICLSNGVCEPANNPHPDPVVWTGFCTGSLWDNTTACPKICQNNLTGTYNSEGREQILDLKSKGWLIMIYQLPVLTIVYHRAERASSAAMKKTTVPPVAVLHLKGVFLGVATVVTTITGPSSTPVITSSGTSATSAAVSTPTYPCPDLDGTSYTDATESSYKIQCSTNYPGNDLPAVHADTFEGCLRLCDTYVPEPSAASDASCIGVSWEPGNPGCNCYFKYQITIINTNDGGLSSAYYANYTLPKSAVTNQGSSLWFKNAPATGSTLAATPKLIPSSGSDSHVAVGVGAGVGVGVPIGLAILAGFFYLMRRQSKTRPEVLMKKHALPNDPDFNTLPQQRAERRVGELPAENKPGELFDPRGPRAEIG
ncbi:MAG: hypothetical protein ASARMPREDX12_008444 [Alectoria sarmentosa]|nr:MAG: hypothetical protein ASARMPREDX12_008444 [Alectoria sarmentosa]